MVFVAIVPFLNEQSYLGELLKSLAAQTRQADRLLLVDDGSTDGSYELACRFARGQGDAVEVLRRTARVGHRDRLAGGSALAAFQWGLEWVGDSWDVAGKLDADLRLTPRTFETLERAFRSDPQLGIAGAYLSEERGGRLERLKSRPEHVNGATKFYRRPCYEDISPLPIAVGWDMIDTSTARLRGWRTASVEMPEGDPLHLRPMGTYDGTLRGWRRWGLGAYAMGEAPLHVLLYSLQRMPDRPRVIGGLNYGLGWMLGGVRRVPRAQPDVRAFVRRNQLRRIRRRFARLGRREPAGA